MKKALWLQLPHCRAPESLKDWAKELNAYRRLQWVVRRTPERIEEERRYCARVPEWLRLPENRWCRVRLLLLGSRMRGQPMSPLPGTAWHALAV